MSLISVGRTDFRALISLRRSLDSSITLSLELHSGQRQVKPRFAKIDFVRLPKERLSYPSGRGINESFGEWEMYLTAQSDFITWIDIFEGKYLKR